MRNLMLSVTKHADFTPNYAIGRNAETLTDVRSLNPVKLGNGLPNVTRDELTKQKRVNFALLVDSLIHNQQDGGRFTADELQIITGLSVHTIRIALDDELITCTEKTTSKRGRPTKIYTIPTCDNIRVTVTPGQYGMSDKLPAWAYESITNYRKARYYMLIARGSKYIANRAVQYSRKLLTQIIGVSKSTLIRYEDMLNMTIIRNIQQTQVTRQSLRYMPVGQTGAWIEIKKEGIWRRYPAMWSLAKKALEAGLEIFLYQWLPNEYSLGNWDKYNDLGAPQRKPKMKA